MSITHQIKIIQLNIKSARANKSLLDHYINKNKIDIVILSETWLKKDEIYHIPNYKIETSNSPNGYGGVAIFTKNNIRIRYTTKTINNLEPIEIIEIHTTNLIENLKIISIYIPPKTNYNNPHIINKFKTLLDLYNNETHTIIAGDINAHNPLWESNHTSDARGDALAEIILDSDFLTLNNGDHTYQSNIDGHTSTIDITLAHSHIAHKFDWKKTLKIYARIIS